MRRLMKTEKERARKKERESGRGERMRRIGGGWNVVIILAGGL